MDLGKFTKAVYNPHEVASFSERRKEINNLMPSEFFLRWDKVCKQLQKYPEITSRIEIVNRGY